MTNEMRLQSAIKRKTVIRETLHNTTGHKVKTCTVTRIDKWWYGFSIDGDYFECRWESGYAEYPTKIYFRKNDILEKSKFGYTYGVNADEVKYASSLHFGCGHGIVRTLWVIGEVLSTKRSFDFNNK